MLAVLTSYFEHFSGPVFLRVFDQVDDEGEREHEDVEALLQRQRVRQNEEAVQHDVEQVRLLASQLGSLR